jgi:hypothetical protein
MSYSFADQIKFVDNMNVASQRFANGTGIGTVLASLLGGGYPGGDFPGKIYFVDNIYGTATGDGLTWGTAMSEPSLAIAAWETWRLAQTGTTNASVRGIIYIRGTATAYATITLLPSHCDMIGIGDDPRGNGAGIARIGTDSGTAGDGVHSAETIRGTNFYNLQFQAGSAKVAFDCTDLYRCVFENCAFMGNGVAASPTAGLLVAKASGLVLRNCHFGSSSNSDLVTGIHVTGTHFHNCLIENCLITGTNGIVLDVAVTSSQHSLVQHCIFAGGAGAQTSSIDDNSTDGRCSYSYNSVAVQGTIAAAVAATRYFANTVANATAFGVVANS